ncbi:hypothetical protein JWG45_14490 [Leptospira sp. 201903070]|uniref:Lipoprotein n=1 Tax=Leptospira ainlahdjerensis TaxID=2810033 RepID=A0ABS2UGG8_9LEPT|nr:hypothetical protein [Leptospira ainlahdjerensis]MBM9578357.1 hypothetical protein [Leptospira ainlahdjerensis]
MLRSAALFVLLLILLSFHCSDIPTSPLSRGSEPSKFRKLEYPNIPLLTKSLKEIVKNRKEGSQDFYVSGIFDSYFYLYWKNQKAIYILSSAEGDSEANYVDSILYPTGSSRMEINSNLVESLDQTRGSSFLIQRVFLNSILENCLRGILIRI